MTKAEEFLLIVIMIRFFFSLSTIFIACPTRIFNYETHEKNSHTKPQRHKEKTKNVYIYLNTTPIPKKEQQIAQIARIIFYYKKNFGF